MKPGFFVASKNYLDHKGQTQITTAKTTNKASPNKALHCYTRLLNQERDPDHIDA